MTARRRIAGGLAAAGIALAGAAFATSFVAGVFDHQLALGRPLMRTDGAPLYNPFSIFDWRARWHEDHPRPFIVADLILTLAGLASLMALAVGFRRAGGLKAFGEKAWAHFEDVSEAGLFANEGVVLGAFKSETLCYDGPEHHLLVGASRSGKGRGHVVPTLLAWCHSALVLDVKGELATGDPRHKFPGTAGYRAALGEIAIFAPTRADSARFNPLFEVRRGRDEIRDVQNIVEIIVDPAGDGRHQDFWDRSAKAVLTGVILHVLYAEPDDRKSLAVVRERLANLDATVEEMRATLHRRNPQTGIPEIHPEVLHAAESYRAHETRLRSGVKATAESFFGLFADAMVAANTSASDFRIGDLMCAAKPMTLYLQPPPSDAARLAPLTRLLINQVARALMEHQTEDAQGRTKRRPLLLVLDEFPALGKMPFFETMMGAMAGYGLKAYLVCQSLNHITAAYGRNNVILDNCHVVTAFAAADMETAKTLAAMAGEVWEMRPQETLKRPSSLLWSEGSTTMREERRPLLLPGDVRALPKDTQLVFVSGAKPIRAQKLKFDRERLFTGRLRPPPPPRDARMPAVHDWTDVVAIAVLEKDDKGAVRVRPTRSSPKPSAAPDRAPNSAPPGVQGELPLTISERALAGVRGPHPSTRVGEASAEDANSPAAQSPQAEPREGETTGAQAPEVASPEPNAPPASADTSAKPVRRYPV